MVRFLCETAEKGFNVNLTSIFTFIGMAFSIIVSLVALVWLTCFAVRLLVKTFKKQVQNSYEVFVENSEAKTKSKKERNAIKRQAKDARKMEILNMKEDSRERIHKMKVDKISMKLLEEENKAKERFGLVQDKAEDKVSDKIKKQQVLENLEKENVISEGKTEDSEKENKSKKETKEDKE